MTVTPHRASRTFLAVGALAVALALAMTAVGSESGSRAIRAMAGIALLGGATCAVKVAWDRPRRPRSLALCVDERQAIGRDSGVAVVAVARRRFLIGYGPAGVTRLAELAPPPEEAS